MKKTLILIIIFSSFMIYNFSSYLSLKSKINDFKSLDKKLLILEDYMSSEETITEYNQLLQKYNLYFVSLAYIPPAHEKYNKEIIRSKKNDISIILKENELFISKIIMQLIILGMISVSCITLLIIIYLRKKLKIT